MSKVRFIGDLHLGHNSIPKFSGPQRGGITTVEEHDAWIVQQWNSVCSKNDLIWVLGDACFDKTKLPLLKKMKGSKHLILGNHDEFSLEAYAPYFNKIHGFVKYKSLWLSHAPIHPDELRGKINVHGHTHNHVMMIHDDHRCQDMPDPRYVCVSVEQVNGQPIEIDEVLARAGLPARTR